MAFTLIICILRTKIAVTSKTSSIRNLTFIQQEKGNLFLPWICRVMTTKISITVQLLCVTNNSIAINTWCHHWKTYNKFIYVSLTIYLTFSVFSRIIIWVVQIKLIKWSDNKKRNHCHPLMQRKKNCKGDVKCETWGSLDFELDTKPWWTAGVCCSFSLLWAAAKGERSYDAKLGGRKVCMGARGEWTMLHTSWRQNVLSFSSPWAVHKLVFTVFILEFCTEMFDILARKKGRCYLCLPGFLDLSNMKSA